MPRDQWSKGEKAVARRAFDAARARDYSALADVVRRRSKGINKPGDIWDLHDFLSRQRKDFDEKYDYRYSMLLFIFPRLINEGWLTEAELAGLDEDKRAVIRLMVTGE